VPVYFHQQFVADKAKTKHFDFIFSLEKWLMYALKTVGILFICLNCA